MFDIGFLELIIVSVVGLLVLGPERLPGAIRTVMAYVNKIRRGFAGIRAEVERELQADEFRQDLHNQGIMQELKEAEKALRSELSSGGVKPGKDGYPIDEPAQAPEPATDVDSEPAPEDTAAESAPESEAGSADAHADAGADSVPDQPPAAEPSTAQDTPGEEAPEHESPAAKP